jgi:hypothetical protein
MQTRNEADGYRESFKTTVGLAAWTLAWLATLALAKFGPDLLWGAQPVASWAAVAANVVVGIGWIVAFARYLRAIDELQRKITQDALVVALGVGWVGGFGYVVADGAGLIANEINAGLFPALLGVVFMIAILAGNIRYR